jgi:hypothetical protein
MAILVRDTDRSEIGLLRRGSSRKAGKMRSHGLVDFLGHEILDHLPNILIDSI